LPRIPDLLQQSVVFLYPNAEAVREGGQAGGTGFFIQSRHEDCSKPVQYLVTNIHVAQAEDRIVPIATRNGEVELHQIPGSDWVNHPNGDDIAAVSLPSKPHWAISALDWASLAVMRPRMVELNMGVGDEVFMLGRFIAHGALQLYRPLARFGNVAMMPGPLVKDGRGLEVEAFLVEMRSLSGFSGSPVFAYIGPGTYRGNGTMMPFFSETIGLMGIDTGHKATLGNVCHKEDGKETDLVVSLNTGVSVVAPAWRIEELLTCVAFRNRRSHA